MLGSLSGKSVEVLVLLEGEAPTFALLLLISSRLDFSVADILIGVRVVFVGGVEGV